MATETLNGCQEQEAMESSPLAPGLVDKEHSYSVNNVEKDVGSPVSQNMGIGEPKERFGPTRKEPRAKMSLSPNRGAASKNEATVASDIKIRPPFAKKTILDFLEKASKALPKKAIQPDASKNTCNSEGSVENYSSKCDLGANSSNNQALKNSMDNLCNGGLVDGKSTGAVESPKKEPLKKNVPKARKSAINSASLSVKSIHLGPIANVTLKVPEIGKVLGTNKLAKLGLAHSTPPREPSAARSTLSPVKEPNPSLDSLQSTKNTVLSYSDFCNSQISKSAQPTTVQAIPESNCTQNDVDADLRVGSGAKGMARRGHYSRGKTAKGQPKKKKHKHFKGGRYNLSIQPKKKKYKSNISIRGRPGRRRAYGRSFPSRNEGFSNEQETCGELGETIEEISFNTPGGAPDIEPDGDKLDDKADVQNVDSKESISTEHAATQQPDPPQNNVKRGCFVMRGGRRRHRRRWSRGIVPNHKTKAKSALEAHVAKLRNQSHDIIRKKEHAAVMEHNHPGRGVLKVEEPAEAVEPEHVSDPGNVISQEARRSTRKRKAPADSDDDVQPSVVEEPEGSCEGSKKARTDQDTVSEPGTPGRPPPTLTPIKNIPEADLMDQDDVKEPPGSLSKSLPKLTGLLQAGPSSKMEAAVYTHPLISNPGLLHQQVAAGVVAPAMASAVPQNMQAAIPTASTVRPMVGPGGSELVKYVNTPNGISYPVTPPRTPEDSRSVDSQEGPDHKKPGPLKEGDLIPLCCCKINYNHTQNQFTHVTYCQALDSIDGKVMGCGNKVSKSQLVRPAIKIPFLAVCEVHRRQLNMHQCCPGCGHFCTQGKFYQCKKDGGAGVHYFHKNCQFFQDNKYYCPHCGEESAQVEVYVRLKEPRSLCSFSKPNRVAGQGSNAKISYASSSRGRVDSEKEADKPAVMAKLNDTEITTECLPKGPSRVQLETMLSVLDIENRPKKMRAGPKNLYNPALSGDLERVVYLLCDGCDPGQKNEEQNNESPLHAAAYNGHLAIVHCLVQCGADPNVLDKDLRTPVMFAAEMNQVDVLSYLYKAGAILDMRAEDGMTAVHQAAKAGHKGAVRCLLDSGRLNINVQDDGGWTPLVWAAEHQHVEMVRYLLSRGSDPNLRDSEGNTALHWAAYSGSVGVGELFLDANCNLEAANEHGDRPLHIAARQEHYEMIVLLLARGADSEARNNENDTPISCCLDQNSAVWMALRVNRQLKGLAVQRLEQTERLLHRDISRGRETNPVPVVNGVDNENYPTDFVYVTDNIETTPLNVNRVITSLQSCQCIDNCSSMFCVCGRNSLRCWYDKEGRLVKEFNQTDPPLLFECNKACQCWSTCANRVVQNGVTCRLQVFKTKGRGWGLRTLLDIPQGTFVCEYIGEYISDAEADSREDDSYLFDLDNKDGDTFCIDARKYANLARFINHLCAPNLIPVKVFIDHQDMRFPKICFFASRDIKAYEELGFDYGEKFWIIKWKQFTCECGSEKCKYSSTTIHRTLEEYNRRIAEEENDDQ